MGGESTTKKEIDISIETNKAAFIIVIKNPYEHIIEKDRRWKILFSKEENTDMDMV